MKVVICSVLLWASTALGFAAPASDLAQADPDALLKVYGQLAALQGSDQFAVTENVAFRRDAGTFNLKSGRLTFAAPVADHVVAAVFTGDGLFRLDPPSPIDRRQISRFSGEPNLVDGFHEAVFYFSDDTWATLQKLVAIHSGGDADAAGRILQSTQKIEREQLNSWWENERTGAFPMRNVPARLLADLTDPTSRGLFLADIKSERHDRLFFQVSWNRDSILPAGLANDEEVILMHWKPREYSEFWSGFHLAGEYDHSAHPEHRRLLAHASDETIDADVTNGNRLSAVAEVKFQTLDAPARVLPFDLEGVLRISSITDGTGRKLRFIQEDRAEASDPWLILTEPAIPGQSYTVKIAYDEDSTRDSRVIDQQGAGLYFVGARESWFPSFGAFDDRTNFVLNFTSPKKFVFVATGKSNGSEKQGNNLITHWESEIPFSVVGFNYGNFIAKEKSDSNLTITAYTGRELPDVLEGLKSAMDMQNLGNHNFGQSAENQTGIMTGGLNTAAQAQGAADIGYATFGLYERYFGPLPFKTISITEQPVFGFGQSWPTLVYLPWDSLLDATTRNSLRLQNSAEQREFYDVVAVHEMSHQWWGHMVGWKTYHDQWMSEGFADFSASLFIQASDPKRYRAFWDMRRRHLLSKNEFGHRPVDVAPLWLNYQANAGLEHRLSSVLIYEKGAYVLQMLRTMAEDSRAKDPDGRFIEMMRDFVSTYAGKNASTADFQKIVEKHMGQPMDWFFDEWVYGTEVPSYALNYNFKDGGGGKTIVHMEVAQSGVSDHFMMKVPIYFWAQGAPHRLGLVSITGNNTSTGEVAMPFRPDKITLDEFHTILAEEK